MTFTKLFSSITESTLWQEDANTRLVWITMLAMADRMGRVWGSVPGLAHRARVPVEDCREALKKFMAPDPDSRTTDKEGRRIEEMDGGWTLINHSKYRAIRDEEAIKESKRKHINTKRAIERGVENVDRSRHNAEAEAEAEAPGPTIAQCEKWLLRALANGADYTTKEMITARLALSANGWLWGKNPITDWRSALERQIQTDRERNNHGTSSKNTQKGADRNSGTYNEGKAHLYRKAAVSGRPVS